MNTIGTYNFKKHYKGDTWQGATLTLTNETTEQPINLTGVTIKMQFRKGGKTGSVEKTIDTTDGIVISDAINGVIVIEPFVMDFEDDIYYHDIQLTYPNGYIKTYIRGIQEMEQDITV